MLTLLAICHDLLVAEHHERASPAVPAEGKIVLLLPWFDFSSCMFLLITSN